MVESSADVTISVDDTISVDVTISVDETKTNEKLDSYENKKRGVHDWYDLEVESDSTYGNARVLVYE